jgi:hypothetical protein
MKFSILFLAVLFTLTNVFAQEESRVPGTEVLSRNAKDNTAIIRLVTNSSCNPLVPKFACVCNTNKRKILELMSVDEEFNTVAEVLNAQKIGQVYEGDQLHCIFRVKVQY